MAGADAVEEIKARLDLVDVVGGYVRLQKSGRDFVGLCPFHSEKTPSFRVSQEKQVWYCFPCQDGGDVISFIRRAEHLDFPAALEMLAERAGVELAAGRAGQAQGGARRRRLVVDLNERARAYYEWVLWNSPEGAPGRSVLIERGVPEELARHFGLGFAPAGGAGQDALTRYLVSRAGAGAADVAEAGLAVVRDRSPHGRDRFRHRLMFPIRDERGATVGFGGRAVAEGPQAGPKYLNSPETAAYHKSRALFGLDLARARITAAGEAVIVEGYFDVLAAWVAGVENAVASSGTALTADHVKLLARYCARLALCFDADAAGREAASRAVDLAAAASIPARICVLPEGVKDPGDLMTRDPAAFAACVAGARPEWQVLVDRALEGAEHGSVEDRRAGAERAVRVLARIPVAATRDLYVQQAAERLGLQAASLQTDVATARTKGGRTPRVVLSAPVPAAPDGDEGEGEVGARGGGAAGGGAPDPAPAEVLLGSLVVHRPDVAHLVVDAVGLDPDRIQHPSVRRLVRAALDVPPGAGIPLHRLAPADQRLAARFFLRAVPELQEPPEVLMRAVSDAVALVREAAMSAESEMLRREIQRARDEGRRADEEALAVRLVALAGEAPHLRRRPSGPPPASAPEAPGRVR